MTELNRFPLKTYISVTDYADAYFESMFSVSHRISRSAIETAAEILGNAYQTQKLVFTCGNGGSTALANQMVCDHLKSISMDTTLRPRLISLCSTMENITAISNDISYEDVFAYQLERLAREDDVLVVFSSSGNSENVVRAARWAKENGLQVITLTGFDGGRLDEIAHVNVHVPVHCYGIVEDLHQSITHVIGHYIRQKHMEPELVSQRKF